MTEAPPPRRDLDLEALVAALIQQRRTIVAFLGVVLVVVLLGTMVSKRKYTGTAVIQLLPRAGQELKLTEVVKNDEGGYLEGRDRARTQMQVLLSRKVGEEVVREYNALGYDDLDTTASGLDKFRSSLSASPREDTQLVEISVSHRNPERAALLANLTAKVYAKINLDSRTEAAQQTLVWLDEQIRTYRGLLDEAQKKVVQFKQSNDLVNIDETVDGITTRVTALQTALGEAATQRVLLESRVEQHQQLLAKGHYDVLAGMFQDPVTQSLSSSYAAVTTDAAEVSARYGDQHPENQRAVARVKRVEGLIARQVRRGVMAERSQVQTYLEQESQINEELARIKNELLEKQRLQSEYTELKLGVDRTQQIYDALLSRRMEVDLQARSNLNDVQVLDPALVPSRSSSPNISLNLMVAVVVGLGGGLGLALLRFRFDDSLQSPRDVREYLQAPVLGSLPRLGLATPPVQVEALYSHTPYAEAFRGIRTALLAELAEGPCRRLLIASSEAGEGKTQVALGLAVALAQQGAHVLLVDADLRNPRLHTLLDIPRAPGLADSFVSDGFLRGFQEDFDEVQLGVVPWRTTKAWRTSVPRLHLLPAGAWVAFPNEMLASPEIDRMLERMGGSYQFILIDTPAAIAVADARVLANRADGVVLVAQAGKTPRNSALVAVGLLRQAGARIVGVVLNAAPSPPDPIAQLRELQRRLRWRRTA